MNGQVVDVDTMRTRYEAVLERISGAAKRSGREPDEVRILVASKYYEEEQVKALREIGVRLLGENRADELARKQEQFGADFEWHFIGHLQRRKVRRIVGRVGLIHSVDSVRLVEELARRGQESSIEVLLQINISGEDYKYGITEEKIEPVLEAAADTEGRVSVRGFMTLAPLVEDPEDVRYVFAKLRAVRDRLRDRWGSYFDLAELSMGMSNDYTVAVEEGATLVRIGRALIEGGRFVRRTDGS